MTFEAGYETECWIKLSLLRKLSLMEILRVLQQTEGVEALFEASLGTLIKLVGEAAAREIHMLNMNGETERILSWLSDNEDVGFITFVDPRYPHMMVEAGCAPCTEPRKGDNLSTKMGQRIMASPSGSF